LSIFYQLSYIVPFAILSLLDFRINNWLNLQPCSMDPSIYHNFLPLGQSRARWQGGRSRHPRSSRTSRTPRSTRSAWNTGQWV